MTDIGLNLWIVSATLPVVAYERTYRTDEERRISRMHGLKNT